MKLQNYKKFITAAFVNNKEYEKYQQYQTDKLHGRILTPDGHCVIADDQNPILDLYRWNLREAFRALWARWS